MGRRNVASLAIAAGGIALVVTAFLPWEAIDPYFDLGRGISRPAGWFDVFGGAVLILLSAVDRSRRGDVALLALTAVLVLNVASSLHDMPGDNQSAFSETPSRVFVTPAPWIALLGAVLALSVNLCRSVLVRPNADE